ncbi:MAG: hypothetical protein ABIA93_08035 [Candidatus Woesearchaeota archaeon]
MGLSAHVMDLAYGSDIYFDIVAGIILLLAFVVVWKYYRINKAQTKYKHLLIGFGMLFLSYLFKIISHFKIYYHSEYTHQVGMYTVTHHMVNASNILVYSGLLLHRILLILGFYALYRTYSCKESRKTMLLTVFLLLAIGYLSASAYVVFHLTVLFILLTLTSTYMQRCKADGSTRTKLLAYSFGILALSQIIFFLTVFWIDLYFLGEFIQLAGYFALLLTLLNVISYGKKARPH